MSFSIFKLFRRNPKLDTNIADMHISTEWLSSLQNEDQFLVSFPRSGNRWVRTMLRDVIVLSHPEMPFPQNLKSWLPDIHTAPPSSQSKLHHDLPSRIIKSHNFRALRGRRMAYLFRQASDALVSFYHFHMKHEMWQEKVLALGMERFCLQMLPGWCAHVELALEQVRTAPEQTHLISYEAIKASPLPSLRALVKFYGLPADDDVLQQALENNTFERSRMQTGSRDLPNGPILRQGRVGAAIEELNEEVFAEIERTSGPFYEELTRQMQAQHAAALRE